MDIKDLIAKQTYYYIVERNQYNPIEYPTRINKFWIYKFFYPENNIICAKVYSFSSGCKESWRLYINRLFLNEEEAKEYKDKMIKEETIKDIIK